MFIKFGDKTKKLVVKSGKKIKSDDTEDAVYLDSDDRRAKILKESIEEVDKEGEEDSSEEK